MFLNIVQNAKKRHRLDPKHASRKGCERRQQAWNSLIEMQNKDSRKRVARSERRQTGEVVQADRNDAAAVERDV
jgi:hypothetical protein